MRLLCADLRQCFTLPVELRRRLADACFKPPLIVCQIAGIDTGGTQLALLAFNRLGEAVVFNLQPLGGTFCGFEHLCLRSRRALSIFELRGKRFSLALCLLQRLAGYGQLSAVFAKAVDFRGLPVQVTQPFLCVANIARQGFTRGLDGFKRSGCLVDRFQQNLKSQVITHCGVRYAAAPFRAM